MSQEDIINLKIEGDVGVVKPEDEIVFENSNPLKEETKRKLRNQEIEKLVIDLENVLYLDSSGVGYVISIFKYMRENNGKLVIADLNDKVKRVAELTRLDEIIEVYDDLDSALKALD